MLVDGVWESEGVWNVSLVHAGWWVLVVLKDGDENGS